MSENTALSKLRNSAVNCVGDMFSDQLYVDFTGAAHTESGDADSAFNLTSGDYFKVFNLPQGAVVTQIGWVTHVTDAGGPQFALEMVDATSTGEEAVSATAIGSAYAAVVTHDTTPVIVAAASGSYIKCTGSNADCDDGKVTFFISGFLVKRQS